MKQLKDIVNAITTEYGKQGLLCLIASLVVGFSVGYGCNYSSKDLPKPSKYNYMAMLSKFEQGVAQEGLKRCSIIGSNVVLRSEPSMIYGTSYSVIPHGAKVEFIENVPSGDMDASLAVTAYDIEISQLFHRNLLLPKGTLLRVVKQGNSSYTCNFILNGKSYTKGFSPAQIIVAYTGEWKKVKAYNQVGFIMSGCASEPEYM